MQLPGSVRQLMRLLRQHGYEAYAVGGCVRDNLLGRVPADWDVTTSALPEESLRVFADYPVIETGLRHGTITVLADGEPVEVTTYRVDGTYSDHRHPDNVCFTRSLTEDLARRDFTVNAMAYAPETGVVDPFGGQADLARRVLRCVGTPDCRFAEDALRILRALRFASVLEFALEAETAAAIHRQAPLLREIAPERIWAELKKLICGTAMVQALTDFPDVLAQVLPTVAPLTAQPAEWHRHVLRAAQGKPEICGRMAGLLRGTDASAALRLLRADRETERRVALLAAEPAQLPQPDARTVRHGLARLGAENWQKYLDMFPPEERQSLCDCTRAVLLRGDCWTLDRLAVNGQKLMTAGFVGGRELGAALHFALQCVVDGTLPNEEESLLNALCARYGVQRKEQ